MRIKIDKIYSSYYDGSFDKYILIARIYVNGQLRVQRLFFNTRQEMSRAAEGVWIDY